VAGQMIEKREASPPREGARDLIRRYRCLRVLALAQPLHDVELAAERQVEAGITRSLEWTPSAAAQEARRWVLFRREMLLHEVLLSQMPADVLAEIVDAVSLPGPIAQAGGIYLSVHYSLYSTLLWLRLAREAVSGRSAPLTMVFDSGADARWRFSGNRPLELERAGLIDGRAAHLTDVRAEGWLAVLRTLARRLQDGESVLLMCDAAEAASSKRRLNVRLGKGHLRLPFGPAALAAKARAQVIPVWIRPDADGYAIEAGPRFGADSGEDAAQWLVDSTVGAQPSLWEGWLRFMALVA